MLGNAVNRCQATPIVGLAAITISQIVAERTLTAANTVTSVGDAGRIVPSALDTGADQVGTSNTPSASFAPRTTRMPRPSRNTIASTKYARPWFEP